MREIGIMEVGGFRVGHAQNEEAATGCTVLLCDQMSPAGLDVRGGGPASRESQLLSPVAQAEAINGVLLSGGSAFGLDAAGGVQRYLEERGIGFDVGVTKVPLVCQSCLFDLGVGRADLRPDGAMAYQACENASGEPPAEGNVGAGTGCSVGKYRGMERAMKSGFGTYAVQAGKVAGMTHNGYARAIRPVHTNADGDSIYAVSTGDQEGDVNVVGSMAAWAMERAIVRAVRAAQPAYGLPSCGTL